ncbi:MAG: hypothetical protein ACRENP_25675, partial [Longimicrobiales bacterium]
EIVRRSGVTEVHVRGTRVTGAGSAAARAQVKLRRPLLEREDAWEETDEKRIRALVQRVTVAVPR